MLFSRECKKILFSLTFMLYIITVFAMYLTQFQNDTKEKIYAPQENQADYGMTIKEVPEILMPSAVESLVNSYLANSYPSYPIGFYKDVHLNEKKKNQIAEIITEISGITKQELDNFSYNANGMLTVGADGMMQYNEPEIPSVNIPESLTYEHFRELMRKADDIIGGGSEYSDEYILENFSLVPKTYEDAMKEYDSFLNYDKISGAYARLYCDYMGIVLAILPVFVAVSFAGLDKKSRMEQLAYSRKISSAKLIFTRYAALIFMMIIPVIITAIIAHMTVKKLYSGNSIDNFAIIKNALIWLVPNQC
ncbi:MAG: ABC transporter permease [Ruminococcus sp.]|nr:ABC transporter permease [Ruminococcus sp.]